LEDWVFQELFQGIPRDPIFSKASFQEIFAILTHLDCG